MSEFIKTFKQLSKKDVAIAGGKGASLGEMTQAKIPVPPGFVVLASAFDQFLDKTDLGVEIEAAMHKVNHKDIKSVEQASKKIRDLIYDAVFPEQLGKEIIKEFTKLEAKYVAVRSSATAEDSSIASWAGELETYLNVTQKNLLESVKKCWASLFTPRAIFYRFEQGLHKQKVSVAVAVQVMIQSEISGICFTVHPVTEDRDQIIIEAGYGLGEAIVGGKITPDTYVIHNPRTRTSSVRDKKDWCILDINVSGQKMMITQCLKRGVKQAKVPQSKQEKQKLTNQQILKLAKLCQKIEEHYKVPQDIEWCLDSGRFYVVQSRPITTL